MPSRGPRLGRRWLIVVAVAVLAVGAVVGVVAGECALERLPSEHCRSRRRRTRRRPPRRRPGRPRASSGRRSCGRCSATTPPARGRSPASRTCTRRSRRGWRFGGNALLEFPPVIYGNTLYFEDDGATAKAVDCRERQATLVDASGNAVGRLAGDRRASPRLLIVPTLADTGNSPGNGRIAALSMRTGHVVWSRPLPSGSESSPIVWGDSVYFGDQAGTLYALNVKNGRVRWSYQASGAIKGGPALVGGILYFGDYAGRAYAIRASNGHQMWAVSTERLRFRVRFRELLLDAGRRLRPGLHGQHRRVRVLVRGRQRRRSRGRRTRVPTCMRRRPSPTSRDLARASSSAPTTATSTRSTPARAQSSGPTRPAGGSRARRRSSTASSTTRTSAPRRPTGLDARTGTQVFSFNDGAFTPVVADPNAIFLGGYDVLYELLPRQSAKR